jgi:hypothetical protein
LRSAASSLRFIRRVCVKLLAGKVEDERWRCSSVYLL